MTFSADFESRDLPPAVPPPSPSLMFLPRMMHSAMKSQGIGIIELPASLERPSTRIYARPNLIPLRDESREKLPSRNAVDNLDW
ncbi:hypothetical protein KIN20_030942 [Parelaphostrongylus tenuis]|uniref:Uncharacterized protein n=1 Tax=Parelaphostrongylus tenuis TaxID=148309 RepID=A0AAD5R4X1_PARTN|nr:hypothetical protein KIN20_030942 [Parelaphostrongylus tenuis]